MTVYEHQPLCNCMPDVPVGGAGCVCKPKLKYQSIAELIAYAKTVIFPIQLDDVVWKMINNHIEHQTINLFLAGLEVSNQDMKSMMVETAKKYASVSTPQQSMPILTVSNGTAVKFTQAAHGVG